MPHYKDNAGLFHFLDDASFEHLLPSGCVKITDEEAAVLRAPTLDAVKAAKLAEINAECDKRIASIRSTYPETEVFSWYRQETEARALKADPESFTPLVDRIAAQRGQTREDLADLIIEKADLFATVMAPIFGTRQVLEKQIEGAQTIDELKAIICTL